MTQMVSDASAVSPLLLKRTLHSFEPERLLDAFISTVNLSEVLTRLLRIGVPESKPLRYRNWPCVIAILTST